MELKELLDATAQYLPQKNIRDIEQAYEFACEAGKPDIETSLKVAMILAHLQMDADTIATSLLQGLPENSEISLEKSGSKFKAGVKKLVSGIDRVNSIPWLSPNEEQSESLRKMFLAMAKDIRVVLISLANRLQTMRNLKEFPPETRKELSEETLEIYVPLAHRLGIWEMKSEMEDIAFRTLHPTEYKEITTLLDVKKTEWERAIAHAIRLLRDEFEKAGLTAEVEGRSKSVNSIYKKMIRYADEGKELTDIHDLMAIRVLVNEVQDCYNALGIVHHLWHPIPGQFDDYIANPKGTMYQSLHTTVMALQGKPVEIQIKTYKMHRSNEYGVAAHWRYKEGEKKDVNFEKKITWMRKLIEWQKDLSWTSFVEAIKTDIFMDQVYVFTPMGEIKELPKGSTPLDFAYRVHTELGHRCTGAKINGRLVPLSYQLNSGDVVDILSTKAERGPSLDWLNPSLGYVASSHAKEKIRQWFRKGKRAENLERGKELFDKECRRLGINNDPAEIAKLFSIDDENDFLVAIGCGDINVQQIGIKLESLEKKEEPPPPTPTAAPKKSQIATGVEVLGVGDLLTHLALCCTPVPGDDIVGYVTRTKGVTIHRKDCANLAQLEDQERLVDVSWGTKQESYPVPIIMKVEDRVGLLKDITTAISEAKINIDSISTVHNGDGTNTLHLTIEIPNIGHLSRLLNKLEKLRGVLSASRATAKSKI